MSHLGVFGFDVDREVVAPERLGGCGSDRGDDDAGPEGVGEWFEEVVGLGDLEKVDNLLGRGEDDGVDLVLGQLPDGVAERLEVVGQGPLINGDAGDDGASGLESGKEFGVGLTVFLDGDAEAGDGELGVEGSKEFAPGVGFGGEQVDSGSEFAEWDEGFGASAGNFGSVEGFNPDVSGIFGFDFAGKVAGADPGEEDDEVELVVE